MTRGAGRAYLVIGPESTGTRLLTRVLIAAGCRGDAGHEQAFDAPGPVSADSHPVVWRRSVPHRHTWLTAADIRAKLPGRRLTALVTVRDWHATVESQLRAPHVATRDEARANIQRAESHIHGIIRALAPVAHYTVTYEALVARPVDVQRWLAAELGLTMPDPPVEVYDGNARYYGEGKAV